MRAYSEVMPGVICREVVPTAAALESARQEAETLRAHMIAVQEELDWQGYRLYGLIGDPSMELPPTGWETVAASPRVKSNETLRTLFNRDRHGVGPMQADEVNLVSETIALASKPDSGAKSSALAGNSTSEVPKIELGQRAFEIVLARQIKSGDVETTWFTRHGSTPITDIPANWPAAYQDLIRRRIKLIESDKTIALIE